MSPRALVLAPFASGPLDELRDEYEVVLEPWTVTGRIQDPEELGDRLRREEFDAVVVEADFLFAETFDRAPAIKIAGICRAAINQIDVMAATERGIVVVNTPGRNANAVAEHAIGLMFAVGRRIAESDSFVKSRQWELPSDAYRNMRGVELGGKVVGIVGLGTIGRRVAHLCNALGMHVLGHDPYVSPREAEKLGAVWTDLDLLLESSEFVTLHAPSLRHGKHLLDSEHIARIRNGAIVINTAAADLIDEKALANALLSGKLRGAGIDVFATHPVEPGNPLLGLPNTVLTPHIGGATEETIERYSAAMASDLILFKNGEKPANLVNPEVWERQAR